MRRTGIGLKPLIAIYIMVIISILAAALAYTAVRLSRHGLVMDQTRLRRETLNDMSARLIGLCPGLLDKKPCDSIAGWTKKLKEIYPALVRLSVFDSQGDLAITSDPELAARAMWDAFGARTAGGGPRDDWSVWERGSKRVLEVTVPIEEAGWKLSGLFTLDASDKAAARITYSLLVYTALLAVVMILLGCVLLNRLIVRPLEKLLQSADRISEGDLTFLLAADRGSEMGRLGSSLSRMAQRIEEDQQRLKDQIEELKHLNRELSQAQQGLIRSEKLASVGKLAAGVAHEVGNPISAILGYVGMLRTEEIPDDEQKDILARVEREVERIDKVIKDLLAYSRPGRSDVIQIAPAELVESAMLLIRPQKKFKTINFEIEVSPKLPVVTADADLVRQVLVNLMLNALDVSQTGGQIWARAAVLELGEEGKLLWATETAQSVAESEPGFFEQGEIHRIRPPQDGRGLTSGRRVVVFSIVDDGPGIAEADLIRIFDPFFTTKDPGHGTGLGLAICHSAITAMNGEIWAFSRLGLGTQLAFHLPVEV